MKKIFYTVEKDTYDNGSHNGIEYLNLYHIVNNDLELIDIVETDSDSPFTREEEIFEWISKKDPFLNNYTLKQI